jgi:hypothetical protein
MNTTGRQIDSSSRASMVLDSLRNANIVVDLFGDDVRMELLETLVQTQLLPYHTRSGFVGGDLYGLEKQKLDQSREELYKILVSASAPHIQRVVSSEWNISFLLYLTFCKQTSDHLRELLSSEVKKLYTPPPAAAVVVPPPTSRPSIKSNYVSSSDLDKENSSHHVKKSFPGANTLGKVTGGIGSVAGTVAGTVVDTVGTVAGTVVAVSTTMTSTIGLSASSSHSHVSMEVYEPDINRIAEHGNFVVATLKVIIAIEQEMHKMFDDGVFTLNNNGMTYDSQTLAMIPPNSRQVAENNRDRSYYQQQDRYRCFLMSSVFDDFLDPFIQTERVNMQNLMSSLVNEDVKSIFANAPIAQQPTPPVATSSSSGSGFPLKLSFKSSKSTSSKSQQSTGTATGGGGGGGGGPQNSTGSRLPQPEGEFDLITYSAACQTVFNCSEQLYQAIRSSLLKCTSFTVGRPLLALINEYKVCFQIFAEIIRTALCPPIPTAPEEYHLIGKRKAFQQSLAEEILTCRTIITADKMISLLPQLQNEIQTKVITNSNYLQSSTSLPSSSAAAAATGGTGGTGGTRLSLTPSSQDLDMSSQIQLFEDVISYAIDILVGSILSQVQPCFQVFAAIPWSRVTFVGDCSPYISILSSSLSHLMPKYRKVFHWKHYEVICYRFNCDFLDYFLALIMGLHKICIIGAEQLLLDLNEMKPLLLKLPFISLPIKSLERQTMEVNEFYYDNILKKIKIIEVVLKLLCSCGDDEQIEENFYIMWPDGQERDLEIIKALKMPLIPTSTTTPPSGGGGGGGVMSPLAHRDHSSSSLKTTTTTGVSQSESNDETQSVESTSDTHHHRHHRGSIFLDNKITQGFGDAKNSIDNAMGNLKMKMKIGKKGG